MAHQFARAALVLSFALLPACNQCPEGYQRIDGRCRDLAYEARQEKARADDALAQAARQAQEAAARQEREDARERRYQQIKKISAQNKRCIQEGCDLVPTTPNPEDRDIWRQGQARERLNIRAKIARNEPITDEERATLRAGE